ncbi:hypothetical protein D9757_003256 [Collybiopsis confluens]|uniref:Uncharacterized protein n=1 Tax=Collybiopsis confluens TaxID=2823264 RepID=A0A8H5HYS1_9AGAR|nr:hypothetical protein D9757_003256 [Collybiopsis confluens]
MSKACQSQTTRPIFHPIIAGYVLSRAQVKQWLRFRGMSQSDIDMYGLGGVQFPCMVHYYEHSEEDPPDVVPIRSKDQKGVVYTAYNPMHYILVGRMALVQNGAGDLVKKADLGLDEQTSEYFKHWIGDCFGETKLVYRVQRWPKDVDSFPLLTWKVEAEWNDHSRVGQYFQEMSMARARDPNSVDPDSSEKEFASVRFQPKVWMPVSWYLKNGTIVPPRK